MIRPVAIASALVAALALPLALTACTSPGEDRPPAECMAAFQAMNELAGDAADDDVEAAYERTLNDCETGADWVEVARQYPHAIWISNPDVITDDFYEVSACILFPDTTVCRNES